MSVYALNSYEDEIKFIRSHDKVIIFFGYDECGYCQRIKPLVFHYAAKYPNIKVGYLNVHKVSVRNLQGSPTFVSYSKNSAVDVFVGADTNRLTAMFTNLQTMKWNEKMIF